MIEGEKKRYLMGGKEERAPYLALFIAGEGIRLRERDNRSLIKNLHLLAASPPLNEARTGLIGGFSIHLLPAEHRGQG